MTKTLSRIGWDLRCLPTDGSTGAGIAHATCELWQACIPLASAYGLELIAFAPRGAILSTEENVIRLSSSRAWSLRRMLARERVDLLFCPSGAVPLGSPIPAIPWIHDLAILRRPDWFPQSVLRRTFTTSLVRRGIKRSPKVFAVSRDTAKAVVRQCGYDAARIVVTGQGIELPQATERLPEGLTSPYALVVGTVEPRKNIPFLLDIWPEVCHRLHQEIPLVIAGRDGWGEKLVEPLPPYVQRISNLSEPLRGALLNQAAVVLVPSFYEGFGRVAAEAILSAVPVLVSNRGALPEVVKNSGLSLPLIREYWIHAITDIVKNPPLKALLEEQAQRRSSDFSWKNVANLVLANLANN